MSEREELRERIQRQMKQDSAEEISDRSIYIADLVMSTLDSWIEEQDKGSEYPDGRRVKMIDNTTTSQNLPYMYEEGTLVDKHKDYRTDHGGIVLVEWDQKYGDFHDGLGDTCNGVRCQDQHGWYVNEETLEFI